MSSWSCPNWTWSGCRRPGKKPCSPSYLAEDKIEPEVVENMRSWPHSGFSVDQSVYLPAGDRAGIERLIGYMTRCPFSLSRLVKVTETGQVIYKAEKDACRAFPDPQDDELARGPSGTSRSSTRWNSWPSSPSIFRRRVRTPDPLLRLVLEQGPGNAPQGRRAAAAALEPAAASSSGDAGPAPARSRSSQTWAMLIKRLYEIDPLACPECGGQMKVVAFIEPPQADVIEKILRHCGLWNPSSPRAPPAKDGWVHDPDDPSDGRTASSDEPRELTYVDMDTFEATF